MISNFKKAIMMQNQDTESVIEPNYLTIEALANDLTVSLTTNCEYSFDGIVWLSLAANENTPAIQISLKLYFRKSDLPLANIGVGTFSISKLCNLKGCCYSMLFGDDENHTDITGKDWAFHRLFYNCTTIVNVSKNFLPALLLCYRCYDYMFLGCTSLKTAPDLPATVLAEYCYNNMFDGCSLTTAPELPATVLAPRCYSSMFRNNVRLVSAPELPATNLLLYCYQYMFSNCPSLTTAPDLPATKLQNYCYRYMFDGCYNLTYIKAMFLSQSEGYSQNWVRGVSSTGTFIKNRNATWDVRGDHGIPTGWTVQIAFTPIRCINLSITADDVSGRSTNTKIHWTAEVEGVDDGGNNLTVTFTGTNISESFPQNTSTTDTIERTISYTYMGVTATTTITQGIWIDKGYTINLNNQWQSSSVVNPDTSLYDGVYESFSNKGVNSTAATMYIDIDGYTDFDLYIRSYAESSWDYVMVSQLDQTINNDTSYSNTTLVKAHTRGNQKSGTAIGNYTKVSFTGIDGGQHRITIVYRKDSSSHSGDDRGYVLIPKNQ